MSYFTLSPLDVYVKTDIGENESDMALSLLYDLYVFLCTKYNI